MAVALISSGLQEEFSLISARDLEGTSADRWQSPSPDNWRDPRESDSDSEQQEDSMEEPFDGVLNEERVSDGLSVLGRSALGTEQVYLHLTISNQKLNDIKILCNYVHLQKLDVSGNEINDLSCVSCMPYLTELNASNNKLSTFFDFLPPKNLMVVNLSFNQITDMKDLSAHKSLTTLLLNNNNVQEITGLEKCTSLTHLNLAHNRISSICEFSNLPIKTLNLASNQIKKISGLVNLKRLQSLDLSSNQLSSLDGLEGLELLQMLNLQDNEICQISEIAFIEDLPLLHVLNLQNNPVQVAAVNKYDPPPEVIAARDHMANVMYSMVQPQKILDSTLPNLDTPYPMLVLTGPQSCGKRELVHRMCREFKEFFRYGPCYTTRNPYFGEEKRFDYHFVTPETFEDMTCSGLFLLTMKYSGHYYGLSREAVESVAREGLACCTHMEIEGVRSLKSSYFKPRYILLLPMNKEKYEGWLRRKGLFTRPEIDVAVSRVDMYIKIHQDCPGYFDAVINTDDLDEAYNELRLLVKDYLGLTEPGQSTQSLTRATSGNDSGKPLSGSSPNEAPKGSQNNSNNVFQDSSARNYSSRVSAKVSSQKTPAEEASVQRRQQAARQALAGKTSGTYTQLFQSSRDSRPSSGLSLLSSAGAFSARRSSSQPTPVITIQSPPEERVEPLDLSGIGQEVDNNSGDQKSADTTPETPRLPSSTRSVRTSKSKSCSSLLSAHASRPGSNTKPILPPIPLGRKKSPN
uniref:Guanylate kinase-like domain-containing protein n=1 Tax=Pyxicephalus adspersus TaxID=30357 RepID=A0AAV3AUR6_PYXAD|nr:TPA: hypothetical protein GDO54_007270 [Pyxicephalus adspersus]